MSRPLAVAVCSLTIATTAAVWLWLDHIEAERAEAAVTVEAPAVSAPPRIVPVEVKEVELRGIKESNRPTPGISWKENAPQTVLLGPGERKAITVSVAGNVRLQLQSQVPVSFAFGTVHGEMFADFDTAVRSGACFADAVTESTKECSVVSGASLLIEDARPVSAMLPQAVVAARSGNPLAMIATLKQSRIVFSLSTN